MQTMAAHNTGGLVIVQVKRVVASGSLPARLVHLPGAIVDKVRTHLMPSDNAYTRAASLRKQHLQVGFRYARISMNRG